MNQWINAITEARRDRAEKVPKGFISRRDVEKKLKVKTARAGVILAELLEAKRAECRTFTILINGTPRRVPHYRLK